MWLDVVSQAYNYYLTLPIRTLGQSNLAREYIQRERRDACMAAGTVCFVLCKFFMWMWSEQFGARVFSTRESLRLHCCRHCMCLYVFYEVINGFGHAHSSACVCVNTWISNAVSLA